MTESDDAAADSTLAQPAPVGRDIATRLPLPDDTRSSAAGKSPDAKRPLAQRIERELNAGKARGADALDEFTRVRRMERPAAGGDPPGSRGGHQQTRPFLNSTA